MQAAFPFPEKLFVNEWGSNRSKNAPKRAFYKAEFFLYGLGGIICDPSGLHNSII